MATIPACVDPVDALTRRVATAGAMPLFTCYDLADGSRVELSARTFANWVDKTVNLLSDLGVEEGDEVGLPLLTEAPGHWVGLVWAMACWQAGCTVATGTRDEVLGAAAVVTGPVEAVALPGTETVVCSLHPLGAGLATPVAGATDYAQVLAQPDLHWRAALPSPLVAGGDESLAEVTRVGGRLLLQPSGEPCADLAGLLLAPLLGDGSVVVVRGDGSLDELARIAAAEKALLS